MTEVVTVKFNFKLFKGQPSNFRNERFEWNNWFKRTKDQNKSKTDFDSIQERQSSDSEGRSERIKLRNNEKSYGIASSCELQQKRWISRILIDKIIDEKAIKKDSTSAQRFHRVQRVKKFGRWCSNSRNFFKHR